jgi:hypothetical protein
MKPQRSPELIPVTVLCLGPMLVWGLHFGAVYVVDHIACAAYEAGAEPVVRLTIAIATLLALALLALWGLAAPRRLAGSALGKQTTAFFATVTRLLALLAAVAVVWTGTALFLLPACGALR